MQDNEPPKRPSNEASGPESPRSAQQPPRAPRGQPLTFRRLLAMIGVAMVFVAYQPGGEPSLLNSVVLPLIGAVCAWLMTESVLVVALGVMLLAAAHTDLDAPGVVEPVLYPLLAGIAFIALCIALLRRFRAATAERRAQRAQARRDQDDEAPRS